MCCCCCFCCKLNAFPTPIETIVKPNKKKRTLSTQQHKQKGGLDNDDEQVADALNPSKQPVYLSYYQSRDHPGAKGKQRKWCEAGGVLLIVLIFCVCVCVLFCTPVLFWPVVWSLDVGLFFSLSLSLSLTHLQNYPEKAEAEADGRGKSSGLDQRIGFWGGNVHCPKKNIWLKFGFWVPLANKMK